jgi:hypothetical protein
MEKLLRIRKAGLILTSLLLLLAGGCAARHAPEPMDAQEIDALKTRLGLIAVTRAQYLPHVEVQVPSKGPREGAKDGAKVGALVPIQISFEAMRGCSQSLGCLLLPLAGLALAPVGAVVGGVGGMVTADSPEMVSEREVRIKDALAKLRMQENMRDQFLSRLADLKIFSFTTMTEAGPAMEGEKPDYRQFKSSGISSVNEIDVKKLTLAGWGKVRPNLYVQLEVQVRLISTTDNTEIYCKVFTCSSKSDKFESWAAQDAKKFREEIESCYNDIADWSVNDLYVNDSIIMKEKTYTPGGQSLTRQSTAKCQ